MILIIIILGTQNQGLDYTNLNIVSELVKVKRTLFYYCCLCEAYAMLIFCMILGLVAG